jgi:predicted class III extradiol MEMO1 family dioxygenase
MFLQSLHQTNLYPQGVKELKFSLNECELKKKYTNQDVAKFKSIIPHVRSTRCTTICRYHYKKNL